MPNVELKDWVINKTRLNADCLSKENNRLLLHLSFSTTVPERIDDGISVVTAKLKVNTSEDNEFFFISLKAYFTFDTSIDMKILSDDKKNEILKEDAFPIAYNQLCESVKILFTTTNLKKLNLPPYEEVRKTL